MGTLGKILALLNVLAAITFLGLAGLDYGKRQAWMFAVRQQDFIINGLPVDENQKDTDGRPLVHALGGVNTPPNRMQKELFAGLAEPVKTQKEEVEKRHEALQKATDEAPNPAAKKEIIRAVVVPLARTWGQRDDLQRQLRTKNVQDLMGSDGPFEAAFKEALEGRTVDNQELDWDQRRQAIAHLLFNISDKPEGDPGRFEEQRRTLAVVGLEAYTREVDSQASALLDMAPQIQHALEADLAAFEREHKNLFQQVETLADQVRHLDETLQKQKLLWAHHGTLVQARKGDKAKIETEIDEAKTATKKALGAQSRLEDALFQAHRAIEAAGEKNQQIVRQINTLELGR